MVAFSQNQPTQATIILPTTADRGLLLPFCVRSIQRQTLQAFELFIIGDGVDASTRTVIEELMQQDSRIHFFDHPKHPRRGEIYRHQALQEAKGEIIAYICDRDLWLPHHLQTLADYLDTATLVTTSHYDVQRNQHLFLPYFPVLPGKTARGVLSAAGHRLDFYHTLPYGWRTTPAGRETDQYMWDQMLAQPECRARAVWKPTLLYFKRNDHPGWPTAQRYEELARWEAILQTPNGLLSVMDEVLIDLIRDRNQLRQLKQDWIVLRGKRLSDLPSWFIYKFNRWLKRPAGMRAEENWQPAPTELDY